MSKKHLLPPWRDRLADGTLGPEYGPRTSESYARQVARHRDWSYRPQQLSPTQRADADVIHGYMRMPDGSLRVDGISERESQTYLEIYVAGAGIKTLAARWSVSAGTIKSYIKRLRAKARNA